MITGSAAEPALPAWYSLEFSPAFSAELRSCRCFAHAILEAPTAIWRQHPKIFSTLSLCLQFSYTATIAGWLHGRRQSVQARKQYNGRHCSILIQWIRAPTRAFYLSEKHIIPRANVSALNDPCLCTQTEPCCLL